MATLSDSSSQTDTAQGLRLVFWIVGIVTAVRLIGLKLSVVDLFFDESQYWAWSRELAFGYFSKPPLLAWIIWVAEHVCGSSEACIRAPSPILYFATSLLVYLLARLLYDDKVGFYAAICLALATGAAFSSRIISTDVPLLFFWTLALLAYAKLWIGAGRNWGVVFGVALGLGLLAKYAMIYFLLGVALAAWLDADARRLLREPGFWIGLAIAGLLLLPNVIWNLDNGLVTLRHTGDNIQGGGARFSLLRTLEFIGSQFAVFGPILFAVLLGAMARIASPVLQRADRIMLAFAIPPLALITVTATITHANANWAAPSFISGIVVAVAILVRRADGRALAVTLVIGLVVQAALLVGDAMATRINIPFMKKGDVYSRTLGWRALGEEAGHLAEKSGARTIVGEYRDAVASMLYYWRDQPEPVLAWQNGPVPDHHFELTRALTDVTPQPILFVTYCASPARLTDYFTSVEPVGTITAATGPTTTRTMVAYKLNGRRKPIGPLGPCQ